MPEEIEERYCDGEGPECPKCGATYTADDGAFFDESNGIELDCECGITFHAQPYISTTWTTKPVKPK